MLDVAGTQLGDCPFCDAAEDGSSPCWQALFGESTGTDILWSGKHFMVLADTAPVTRGHLLIAPYGHFTSIAETPAMMLPDLLAARAWATDLLRSTIGPPTFFEHGAANAVHAAGACVDHAHLHVVPGNYPIVSNLLRDFPHLERFSDYDKALRRFAGLPYIYFEDPSGTIHAAEAPLCTTQYLRRLISIGAGHPERWNWRDCIRMASTFGIMDDVKFIHAASRQNSLASP